MKRFSILFCGALVNSVGTGLSAFALAIFMFDAYGTASSVVLVQLSAFAPIVLLAPVAGVLADRFDRRVMMAIGDGGSIGGLLIVMAAVSSERPGIGLVCGGIAASSCFAALTEPALRASVSDLVGPDEYVRASSMLQIASSARYLLSPFLAGMLLPAVGPSSSWTRARAWSRSPAPRPSTRPSGISAAWRRRAASSPSWPRAGAQWPRVPRSAASWPS